jgi:putative Holliday junction resolvase
MERILALDIGHVRVGVAVSDPLGFFAQGIGVLSAAGDWIDEISTLVEQYDVRTLLIGLPVRTDGSTGPEAKWILSTVELLRALFPDQKVELWDERFTTTIAERIMIEGNVSREKRRHSRDKVAAAIILQGYLDNRRRLQGG